MAGFDAMISFIKRNSLAVGVGSILGLAALVWVAIGFFGVHTLFIDDTVSEASPFAAAAAPATEADANPVNQAAVVVTDPAATSSAAEPETVVTADAVPASDETAVAQAPADPVSDLVSGSDVTAPPAAEPSSVPQPTPEPTAPPEPQVVNSARGSIVNHDHQGVGTVNVLTDGVQTFVRFEDDFSIDNGPDLNVYLVRGAEADGDPSLFDDDFIDLGDLKGNVGSQNYEVPAGTDLGEYDTLVIWCVRFGVAFNAAPLDAL